MVYDEYSTKKKKKLSKTSKTPTFPACLQRELNKNLIACFFRL